MNEEGIQKKKKTEKENIRMRKFRNVNTFFYTINHKFPLRIGYFLLFSKNLKIEILVHGTRGRGCRSFQGV